MKIKRIAIFILIIIIFLGSIAMGYLIFGKMDAADKASVSLEAIKVILQFVFVVILGAFISYLIKSFENSKRDDLSIQKFREEFLKKVHNFYSDVIKCRRILRNSELHKQTTNITMDDEQLKVYKEQSEILGDLQLEFERLKMEAENFKKSFPESTDLLKHMDNMNGFIKKCLTEFEKYYPKLVKNKSSVEIKLFIELFNLTDDDENSAFRNNFVNEYDSTIKLLRNGLLPKYVSVN